MEGNLGWGEGSGNVARGAEAFFFFFYLTLLQVWRGKTARTAEYLLKPGCHRAPLSTVLSSSSSKKWLIPSRYLDLNFKLGLGLGG